MKSPSVLSRHRGIALCDADNFHVIPTPGGIQKTSHVTMDHANNADTQRGSLCDSKWMRQYQEASSNTPRDSGKEHVQSC
jgi:hypothetical protein